MGYVLDKYKTSICPRPPRQCRQGFACPYFHNNAKDRRRSPAICKYKCAFAPSFPKANNTTLLSLTFGLGAFLKTSFVLFYSLYTLVYLVLHFVLYTNIREFSILCAQIICVPRREARRRVGRSVRVRSGRRVPNVSHSQRAAVPP